MYIHGIIERYCFHSRHIVRIHTLYDYAMIILVLSIEVYLRDFYVLFLALFRLIRLKLEQIYIVELPSELVAAQNQTLKIN